MPADLHSLKARRADLPGVHFCCVVIQAQWLQSPCCCRILVSSGHWPTSYLNKAKRCLQEHGQVQLSALGTAIAAMVTGGRPSRHTVVQDCLTCSF